MFRVPPSCRPARGRPPRALLGLVLTVLAACAEPQPVEQYGFLTLLGQDTIAIERVTRYPSRFVSEAVDRFPLVRQRHTEIDLAADGSPRHMDMRVHIPSAVEAGGGERRIVAEFGETSLRVSLTDSSGTRTLEQATDGMLTVPHVPQMYSLLELYFAAALERAARESLPAGGRITARQFYPDREFSNYPNPLHRGYVTPRPGGVAEIQHNWLAGTGRAVLDSSRRMLSYSGAGTTYLVEVTRLAEPPEVAAIGARFAAEEQARGAANAISPPDSVSASIGPATITVAYGRPRARGRTLLGQVIPYDRVWRTGANEATHFTTTAPIRLGGISLAAGTYTLWTLPRLDGVSLIVNRQTGQWGTGYGPAHDVGRTPLATSASPAPVEVFTISIEPGGARTGVLALAWGPFRWTAPIVVE
jgi:hypothetical protein